MPCDSVSIKRGSTLLSYRALQPKHTKEQQTDTMQVARYLAIVSAFFSVALALPATSGLETQLVRRSFKQTPENRTTGTRCIYQEHTQRCLARPPK